MRTRRDGQQKRFGWLVLITLLLWSIIFLMIWKIEPNNLRDLLIPNSYLLVGGLIYITLLPTLAILFLSTKKGAFGAAVLTMALLFRIWKVGNWLSFISLVGIATCLHLYFWTLKKS